MNRIEIILCVEFQKNQNIDYLFGRVFDALKNSLLRQY